jgi:long-chain acyl-CoA synthetase
MAKNVAELWRSRTRETPDALAFEHRVAGTWTPVTWRQADERVRRVAAGLVARGVARGDRVALLASTRLEWILCDFGVLCAGAAVSTVYPSNTADEVAFVLEDAGCVAVVVEDAAQLQKLRQEQARLGAVRLVVVIDPAGCDGDGWLALSTLEDEGGRALAADPACVDARIDATGPEDLATLIYTSGTTGRPKGVMLVHDNWLVQAEAITADLRPHLQPGDKQYLFLPLAHSFGKICELIAVAVGIPTAVEGRIDLVVDGLLATRPTILCAVPRVFEKISARIRNGAAQKGPRAVAVLKWAQRVGAERLARQDAGRRVGVRLTIQHAIADRLVFRKLRDALGGRIRAFLSGGAPLSIDLAVFFRAAGMVILEGYGLTETAAASTANRLDDFAFGTVGKPFEGGQVAIAPDGEVLLRGRHVMRGYWNRPQDTAAVLDADGWFHTGDLGSVDAAGRLHITGRKKDLIITSGGKNIAPLDTESRLKAATELVAELVMQGDRRNYCVGLVWLDPEVLEKRDAAAGRHRTFAEASADPAVRAEVQAAMDGINGTLASYEQVKKLLFLDHPLDAASGLLTPSMKVKRNLVADRYAAVLDAAYTEP